MYVYMKAMRRRQWQPTATNNTRVIQETFVDMTRKRRNSNSHARVARRRQALHILATLVVLIGAANVLEKLTGAASLLSKSIQYNNGSFQTRLDSEITTSTHHDAPGWE